MIYCPKCGVALRSKESHCPLCNVSLAPLKEFFAEEEKAQAVSQARGASEAVSSTGRGEEVPQLYPERENRPKTQVQAMSSREKKKLGVLIVGLIFVLPIFSTLAIDLAINRGITWSQYVFFPISLLSLAALAFVLKPRTPIIGITVTLVAVFLLTYLTNGVAQGAWNWELGNTIFLYSILIAEILSLYIIYLRRGWVSIVVASFLAVVALLLGLDFLISGLPLGWSLIVTLPLIAMVFFLWYASLVKKKGLNLIGAATLDLTLYLMGLNLLINQQVSWSWIPFAFLMPLSLCSYLLNAFWFKDTDWKKALHL